MTLLLPNHRLRLHVEQNVGARAVERFARLFRGTWAKLPLDARRAVLRMWRFPYRSVRLARMRWGDALYSEVVIGAELDGDTHGLHDCGRVAYDLVKLDAWDDASVAWVIAHELAHVVILAGPEWVEFAAARSPEYSTDSNAYRFDPEEQRVRQMLREWGFGMPRIWPVAAGPVTIRCGRRRRQTA